MRDTEWYKNQGRSDPHSEEQKYEHPYDFVQLPEKKYYFPKDAIDKMGHNHLLKEFTGSMEIILEVVHQISVGNGLLELYQNGKIAKTIVKSDGKAIIPGSSLKGAVRSHFEAITQSCVGVFKSSANESYSEDRKFNKIPLDIQKKNGLSGQGKIRVKLDLNRNIQPCPSIRNANELHKLCPACLLFGAEGYQSRVVFSDAILFQDEAPISLASLPSLNQPHLHRVGREIKKSEKELLVTELEGRKFYYGSINQVGTRDNGNERIEVITRGTKFKFTFIFRNVSKEELGGIFAAIGINEEVCYFRIGGGKPVGFGKVVPKIHTIKLLSKRDFEHYERPDESEKFMPDIQEWIASFKQSPFFHEQGLKDLIQIAQI